MSTRKQLLRKYETRVARGAKLLDRTEPGWAALIALADLNLMSDEFCVLGQTDRMFEEHRQKLGLTEDAAIAHGFNLGSDTSKIKHSYALLAEAWFPLIYKRQVALARKKLRPPAVTGAR